MYRIPRSSAAGYFICKRKELGTEDSLPAEGEGKTTYKLASLTQSILVLSQTEWVKSLSLEGRGLGEGD